MSIKMLSKQECGKGKKIKKCKMSKKDNLKTWGEKYCMYCDYYELVEWHMASEDKGYCHYYGSARNGYSSPCSHYTED